MLATYASPRRGRPHIRVAPRLLWIVPCCMVNASTVDVADIPPAVRAEVEATLAEVQQLAEARAGVLSACRRRLLGELAGLRAGGRPLADRRAVLRLVTCIRQVDAALEKLKDTDATRTKVVEASMTTFRRAWRRGEHGTTPAPPEPSTDHVGRARAPVADPPHPHPDLERDHPWDGAHGTTYCSADSSGNGLPNPPMCGPWTAAGKGGQKRRRDADDCPETDTHQRGALACGALACGALPCGALACGALPCGALACGAKGVGTCETHHPEVAGAKKRLPIRGNPAAAVAEGTQRTGQSMQVPDVHAASGGVGGPAFGTAVTPGGVTGPDAPTAFTAAKVKAAVRALGREMDRLAYAQSLARELRYSLGLEDRPARPPPIADACPRCGVALQKNAAAQHLVCPTCRYWCRLADMTPAGLSFGAADRDYSRAYDPTGHLNNTMKNAEAGEAYTAPAVHVQLLQQVFWHYRIPPWELSPPLIRKVIYDLKVKALKADIMVQLHARMTGIVPWRTSAHDKEENRMMFSTQAPRFLHHAVNRVNKPFYPETYYKQCELRGHLEMCLCVPLLRSIPNLVKHDRTCRGVFGDLDWQFIPTTTPFQVMDVATIQVACMKAELFKAKKAEADAGPCADEDPRDH